MTAVAGMVDPLAAGAMAQPRSADELINVVRLRRSTMPPKLRVIADFLINRTAELPIHSITELAAMMDTAPSAIVRFAKALGFSGFSEMQRLLRTQVMRDRRSYTSRISGLARPGDGTISTERYVLDAYFEANIAALQDYQAAIDVEAVQEIVEALARARLIAVMGQKRAFPVASYLFYGLSMLECSALLLDGVGGLSARQSSLLGGGDVLVAISFAPYAPEVIATVEAVRAKGCRIIAITDGATSPLAALADLTLTPQDSNLNDIRSITVTSTVLQALFVSLGLRMARK